MGITKEGVKALGGFLLNGGISCTLAACTGGAAPLITGGGALVAGLVSSMTSGYAGDHTKVLASMGQKKLLTWLQKEHPDNLNHDLERLFKTSAAASLKFMKTIFIAEIKDSERMDLLSAREKRKFTKALEGFFDQGLKDHALFDEDDDKLISKETITDPLYYLKKIVSRIFTMTDYRFDETTQKQLVDFYADKLPYCFDLAFKEALKVDDKGFKAFQIWMLEEMRDSNVELLKGQKKIEALIKEVQDGQWLITKEKRDELLDGIAGKVYDKLEEHFVDIKQQLNDLLIEVAELKSYVKGVAGRMINVEKELTKLRVELRRRIVQNEISHRLTDYMPAMPAVFYGRGEELKDLRKELIEGNNFLLLVNGQGGIGKTSLAAAYYHKYHRKYKHAAWVLSEESIANAILLLAPALGLDFPDDMITEDRAKLVFATITELEEPCLLVIDNANERKDLIKYQQLLRTCSNFHLLITSRSRKIPGALDYPVEALSFDAALAVFKEHYKNYDEQEEDLFKEVWEAVGKNTLVIELLAKNLEVINEHEQTYTLQDLLKDLQEKGVLAIKSDKVYAAYQGKGELRHEKPEAIIAAMYDVRKLSADEVELLSIFSVLPSENISHGVLKVITYGKDEKWLTGALNPLYDKGWLTGTKGENKMMFYKISPVIQDVFKEKNKQDIVDILQYTISVFNFSLAYHPDVRSLRYLSISQAKVMIRYAISIIENLENIQKSKDTNLATLAERVGNYYELTGDISSQKYYYERFLSMAEDASEYDKNNMATKSDLGVSYLKIGTWYKNVDENDLAEEYLVRYKALKEEIYDSDKNDARSKANLAGAYGNLADFYIGNEDFDKAEINIKKLIDLFEQLHNEYDNNNDYKHGLLKSYSKYFELHLGLNDLIKAKKCIDKAIGLCKEIYFEDKSNAAYKHSYAISHFKLGQLHKELEDYQQAVEYYTEVVTLLSELNKEYDGNAIYAFELALAHSHLGNVYLNFDVEKGKESLHMARGFFEELIELDPNNAAYRHSLNRVKKVLSEINKTAP